MILCSRSRLRFHTVKKKCIVMFENDLEMLLGWFYANMVSEFKGKGAEDVPPLFDILVDDIDVDDVEVGMERHGGAVEHELEINLVSVENKGDHQPEARYKFDLFDKNYKKKNGFNR
ncbi:sensor domain-containing diguanylate cyclase [Sesbania bispinosa]|nr:sensor domain-containing diguanylate cyclase [Sesbania bispinosa]